MAETGSGRLKGVRLGFIGAGAMGGAIIQGLLAGGRVAGKDLVYYDPERTRQKQMDQLGVQAAKAPAAVMEAQVVLLAVKPQIMGQVVAEIQAAACPDHLIISIAAGVTLKALETALPQSRVIRAMPNTPTLAGAGMAALAPGGRATPLDLALALEIFEAVGRAVVVEEKLMDAVTGLSGSGPAYVAVFLGALTDGGVKMGLPRPLALLLASQTVIGAARLCLEKEITPGTLKDLVTSPGGTTIAGLHVLEEGRFRGLVMSAVEAAARRARELGKE